MPFVDDDGSPFNPTTRKVPSPYEIVRLNKIRAETGFNLIPMYKDFHKKTTAKGNIAWTETIKIRNKLKGYFRPSGYPVKFEKYVGYFSGVSFWIPAGWMVHNEATIFSWKDHMQMDLGFLNVDNSALPLREVFIWFVGQEFMSFIQQLIPFQLETGIFNFMSSGLSLKTLDIFENLSFYETLNDAVIFANWDKVKVLLEKIEGF